MDLRSHFTAVAQHPLMEDLARQNWHKHGSSKPVST
jgi:hypothetical protein